MRYIDEEIKNLLYMKVIWKNRVNVYVCFTWVGGIERSCICPLNVIKTLSFEINAWLFNVMHILKEIIITKSNDWQNDGLYVLTRAIWFIKRWLANLCTTCIQEDNIVREWQLTDLGTTLDRYNTTVHEKQLAGFYALPTRENIGVRYKWLTSRQFVIVVEDIGVCERPLAEQHIYHT